MDDDLGTPAAVAAIYDVVREGNKLLADGDSPALRGVAVSVRAMLAVLGLDPLDPHWSAGGSSETEAKLTTAVDALVARAARAARRRRAPRRTSRPPTRSATSSRPPASSSRTPPQGPTWSL